MDHRLVRKGHISNHSHGALALYLFLVTVADRNGISYYSDKVLGKHINMNRIDLGKFRRELCRGKLIAYRKPYYQVLKMPHTEAENQNFSEVLRLALDPENEHSQPDESCQKSISGNKREVITDNPHDEPVKIGRVLEMIAGEDI